MTTSTTHLFDLFISYAAADREWVEGYLFDTLKAASVRYFSDAAFQLGVPRLVEFERGVKQSKRTLLVLSPAYMSDNVAQFVDILAQSYGLDAGAWSVIPLILQPVTLPPRLALLTPLDATDPDRWDQTIDRLFAALQTPVPGPAVKPSCPYPGMAPFRAEESAYFFGREGEVKLLLQQLRHHPFITIIGPSGSGKSSLVFAGLLPALQRSGLFGAGSWAVRTMRPGEHPLAALQDALGVTTLAPLDLAPLLAADPAAQRLLLVVDQFEELFTLGSAEAAPFLHGLQQLMDLAGCYVVLTVRADFYTELITSPLWGEIQQHRLEITPLDEEGLRQAIVRPAEQVGVYIESALVERLLANAAGEPGVLPFLQEVLVLLWEKLERRFLPLHAYEALVLPYTALTGEERTGLQVAMAQKADAIFNKLTPAQQAIARRIFLRLVQFGEGRQDTRRQQPVSALRVVGEEDERFAQTLHYLAENRLLTISGEGQGDPKVDLSHEAMIEGWPLLQDWIIKWKTAEKTRRHLAQEVQEWQRLGSKRAGLLVANALTEAEQWLATPDAKALGIDGYLTEFIEASRVAHNPGWHTGGLVTLLLGVGAVAGLIGWLYSYLKFISAPGTLGTSATFATVFLALLALITIHLLKRSDLHYLEKVSQTVGKKKVLQTTIGVTSAAVVLLWVMLGQHIWVTEQFCSGLGVRNQNQQVNVALVEDHFESSKMTLFALALNRETNFSIFAALVPWASMERCISTINYAVRVKQISDRNGQDVIHVATITNLRSNQNAHTVQVGDITDRCSSMIELASKTAESIGYSTNFASGFDVQLPETCTPLVRYYEAYRYYDQKRFREAERDLQKVLTDSPEYANAHALLGLVYLAQGDHRNSITEIQRAIELAKNEAGLFYGYLGRACFSAQTYSCAEAAYQQAVAHTPESWMDNLLIYHNALATVYREEQKYKMAESTLATIESLLNANPSTATADNRFLLLRNRGILAFKQERYLQAVESLENAEHLVAQLKQNTQQFSEEIVYYLALTHESLGDSRKTCNYWNQYTEIPTSELPGELKRRELARTKIKDLGC